MVVPLSVPQWYHHAVAMNLRLSPETQQAVRREAERSGRSQQEVVREAIDRHLALAARVDSRGDLDLLVSTGTVRPPRVPYRQVPKRLTLPPGVASAGLLDRDDRI